MSSNRGNNRRRGRGNNRQQGGQPVNRVDSRARGNAPQLLEKYRKLAHDAHLNGDRVLEEYNLQFADHYFRVLADTRQRQDEVRQRRDERWQDNGDSDRDDGDDIGEEGGERDSAGYSRNDDRPARSREAVTGNEDQSDDEKTDAERGRDDAERSQFEPAENPFVREGRTPRAPRSMKPRRPRREEPDDNGDQDAGVLDPASLPPSISEVREETPAAETATTEPEAKPRRRTRRKPAADDTGEPLQSVG